MRLAATLLQLQAQGAACPWLPYLCTLPRSVPSPLTEFSWEDIEALQYQPMLHLVHHSSWLASSAGHLLGGGSSPHDASSPDDASSSSNSNSSNSSGGFSQDQVDWALSVVHSRTFGAPGKEGAVAVSDRHHSCAMSLCDPASAGGCCASLSLAAAGCPASTSADRALSGACGLPVGGQVAWQTLFFSRGLCHLSTQRG